MSFNFKGLSSLIRLFLELWERRRQQRCPHYDLTTHSDGIALTLTLLPIDWSLSHCTQCGFVANHIWWDGYRELALDRATAIASRATGRPWSWR